MINIIKDLKEIGITKFAKINKDCLLSTGNQSDYIKIFYGSIVGVLDYKDNSYKRAYVLNGNVYHLVIIKRDYLDFMENL